MPFDSLIKKFFIDVDSSASFSLKRIDNVISLFLVSKAYCKIKASCVESKVFRTIAGVWTKIINNREIIPIFVSSILNRKKRK